MLWDVFISYASEDRNEVAEPLAIALVNEGLKVWFDEFVLKVGDSLRRKIDEGLASSEYGIVILTPSFFTKHFTNLELNALSQREVNGKKVILPVWHNVEDGNVRAYSPSLADRKAVLWKSGLGSAVKTLKQVITDEQSIEEDITGHIDFDVPEKDMSRYNLSGIARHSGDSLVGKTREVYQEAYSRWSRLFGLIHSDDLEKHKLVQETRDWFNNNNMYLHKKIRQEIDDFIRDVAIYGTELDNYHAQGRQTNQWDTEEMITQRKHLREKFRRISALGRRIQNSI